MKSESKACFDSLCREHRRDHPPADLTPTVCGLFGVPAPESAEQAHLVAAERFAAIHAAMERHWSGFNRVLAFVPDHGGHAAGETHGGHGTDLPDDMLVSHCCRIDEKR